MALVTLANPAAGNERRKAGWGALMMDDDGLHGERG